MLLMLDNYDSFTYNLVQYFGELGEDVVVYRNDAIDTDGIQTLKPDLLVISPGPGDPEQAGVSLNVIRTFAGKVPLLGVCLGHQAIGRAFGGDIVHAAEIMHGKSSPIIHENTDLFRGLPNPFAATRYHSLVVKRQSLPTELKVTASTEDGTIMGLAHRTLPVWGVQFHPESIISQAGYELLQNFLDLGKDYGVRT
ncbi:MAG: aminodeoxychorismate/anthranilate synthase component II [Desulfuromonadaceae bacterium]|nr:aminodeoxychorismate/anthranilate synthase component II [Desulfuromonadaceae bacterium]